MPDPNDYMTPPPLPPPPPLSNDSGSVPPPLPPGSSGAAFVPPTYPGALNAGMLPDRGGLILGFGIGSLGLALFGLLGGGATGGGCCLLNLVAIGLGIAAWVMANSDLAMMRAGRMTRLGEGNTRGGKICAIISLVLHLIAIVIAIIVLIVAGSLLGFAAFNMP